MTLADDIKSLLTHAAELYHRLVLVVSTTGKTAALQVLAGRDGLPLISLNLELSRRLLDYTQQQRPLQVGRLLAEIVEATGRETVLVDNIEILFVAWPGEIAGGQVTYGTSDHAEYRHYAASDLLLVTAEAPTQPRPDETSRTR
jgi:hypothetical protein